MKNWPLLVCTVCVSKLHPGRPEKCVGAGGAFEESEPYLLALVVAFVYVASRESAQAAGQLSVKFHPAFLYFVDTIKYAHMGRTKAQAEPQESRA